MSSILVADLELPNVAIIRGRTWVLDLSLKFCECGRDAVFLCDWRILNWEVMHLKSGTCDFPICVKCAENVGLDKHLCKFHAKAYQEWKRRHPEKVVPPMDEQLRLGL